MIRWGLIGFGRAGTARARAIQADPRSSLVAGMRGGIGAFGIEPSPTLKHLLDQVDAVAVCSPTDTHVQLVDAALRAGKHVVCEYPLAPSRAQAEALFAMAPGVLHVEHIELLAESHRVFSEQLVGRTPTRVEVSVRTPGRLVSSLHRVFDALGEVPVLVARGDAGIRVTAPTRTVELRGRSVLVDGVELPCAHAPGLFARDHAVAVRRILDGDVSYVSDARILEVLDRTQELLGAGLGG